jgi:single-strand DNA-binding protein
MAGMCKVTLIGNLGADAELRYSQQSKPICKFRVAVNTSKRTPQGEWQEHTEWFGVTLFGPRAEQMSERLLKGSRVYVEGRLETRVWEDAPDGRRFFLDVVANEIVQLDGRPRGEGGDMPSRPAQTVPDEPDTLDDVPF